MYLLKKETIVLTPDYPPELYGGIGTYVGQLYENFSEKNVKICMFPFMRESVLDAESNNFYCRNFSQMLAEFKNDVFVYWEKFNKAIYKFLCDKIDNDGWGAADIHVHGSYFAIVAMAIKKKYHSRIVYFKHGIETNIYDSDYIKDELLLLGADLIICPSQWVKNMLIKSYQYSFLNMRVIPSGIKVTMANDFVEQRERNILFCGRLSKKKGGEIFVKAIEIVAEFLREKSYQVHIIGDGEEREVLERYVKTNLLNDIIRIHGKQSYDKVLEWMKKSEIMVVPSRAEAFGLVALEGFSQKCFVIASNEGGLAEIVEGRGMLCKRDEYDIADTIKYVIENPNECTALKEKAFSSLRYYSWERVASDLSEVLNS